MTWPEIVAHRGAPGTQAPANSLAAFERAIALGADAVELDVRLSRDWVPHVFHNVYLDGLTALSGPIFAYSSGELRECARLQAQPASSPVPEHVGQPSQSIASLREVLEVLDGRIRLEVEIKGPEPEAAEIVAQALQQSPACLPGLEVTSYETSLLHDFRRSLPGVPTDLLVPLSEPWMGLDVLAYFAAQRGRLAGARAVHLHASQLSAPVVETIRAQGLEVHAWGVNDAANLAQALELGIPRLCTDQLTLILSLKP